MEIIWFSHEYLNAQCKSKIIKYQDYGFLIKRVFSFHDCWCNSIIRFHRKKLQIRIKWINLNRWNDTIELNRVQMSLSFLTTKWTLKKQWRLTKRGKQNVRKHSVRNLKMGMALRQERKYRYKGCKPFGLFRARDRQNLAINSTK